jgi:hypothetical protein
MKTRFTLAIFLLPVCCLAVDAQQLLRIRATPPASAGGSSISQLQPNTLEDPGDTTGFSRWFFNFTATTEHP